jgi:DNA polymerase II small subunit/DNA polymerase delta subunit B
VSNFRSTTLVCGSCWQERTTYEEKLGLNPEPARVPVVNLQTREVKILRF